MRTKFTKLFAVIVTTVMLVVNMCFNYQDSISQWTASAATTILGDINGDGRINAKDLTLLKRSLTEKSAVNTALADLDGDNAVTLNDVESMVQYLLAEIRFFPAELKIDSDGDGFCDLIETLYTLTDPMVSDTDKDGLSDYDEVCKLYSDPVTFDSKSTGMSDGLSDFDEDGLTNADEIQAGMNPWIGDSDYDGISDYDEVKKHKTSPILSDTDSDGLSDYDEVCLELNPLNSMTNAGVQDIDCIIEQNVECDSPALNQINHETNYECSLVARASGCARNGALMARVIHHAIQNNDSSIKSDIISISYKDSYQFESATISFKISKSYLASSNTLYDDYVIFKLYEDSNLLLPVETTYATDGQTISCDSTELGSFCVVYAPEWLNNKQFEADYEEIDTSAVQYSMGKPMTITAAKLPDYWYREIGNVEVVFIVDSCVLLSDDNLKKTKSSILSACKSIYSRATSAKIAIYSYYDESMEPKYAYLPDAEDNKWATNYASVEEMVGFLKPLSSSTTNYCDYGFALAGNESLFTGTCANQFAFITIDSPAELKSTYRYTDALLFSTYANQIEANNVKTSIIMPQDMKSSYPDAIERFEKFVEMLHGTIIYKSNVTFGFDVFSKVYFSLAKITWADLMKYIGYDNLVNSDGKTINTEIDDDEDGVKDYIEARLHNYVNKNEPQLPTLEETIESYDEADLINFAKYLSEATFALLQASPIMAVNSYCAQKDSDNDGIIDRKDDEPLIPCENVSKCIFYDKYEPDWDSKAYYEEYVEGFNEHDVKNHALSLAIVTDDDGIPCIRYVCSHCGEQFITPEEQDPDLLTSAQYALVTSLEKAYSHYASKGDIMNAESIYMVIDSIRSQAAGIHYDYKSSGIYCSPMDYQTPKDELSYVNISIEKASNLAPFDLSLTDGLVDSVLSLDTNVSYLVTLKHAIKMGKSILNQPTNDYSSNTITLLIDALSLFNIVAPKEAAILSIAFSGFFFYQDVSTQLDLYQSNLIPRFTYDIYTETKNDNQNVLFHSGYSFNSNHDDMIFQLDTYKLSSDNGLNNPSLHGSFSISTLNLDQLGLITNQAVPMCG